VYQSPGQDHAPVLSAHHNQTLLNGSFDLPQVGSLSDKDGTLCQFRKEVQVVCMEIGKEIFVASKFEVLTTNFHRYDLFVGQSWRTPILQGFRPVDHFLKELHIRYATCS
jgi:hypothetical protein